MRRLIRLTDSPTAAAVLAFAILFVPVLLLGVLLGMDRLESADRSGTIVLLSKHQSTWETFALPCLMPHPLCYVFKRELLFVPFFCAATTAKGHACI